MGKPEVRCRCSVRMDAVGRRLVGTHDLRARSDLHRLSLIDSCFRHVTFVKGLQECMSERDAILC